MERDFNQTAWLRIDKFLREFPDGLREFENLLVRNKFLGRTIGCNQFLQSVHYYSFKDPNLRAAGVDYDVRVMTHILP